MDTYTHCHCEEDECLGKQCGICVTVYQSLSYDDRMDLRNEYNMSKRCKDCQLSPGLCVCEMLSGVMPRRGRAPPLKQKREANVQSDRWFVTVSVRDDSNIVNLWKRVEKFIGMMKCIYVIANMDQSGIDEYKHPHVHFYVEYPKVLYKSKVIQVFANAFTDYIGGVNFVDARIAGEHHIRYCKGEKVDDKMEIVDKSRSYRQKNNIPEYIERYGQVSHADAAVS